MQTRIGKKRGGEVNGRGRGRGSYRKEFGTKKETALKDEGEIKSRSCQIKQGFPAKIKKHHYFFSNYAQEQ